jgi:hypothetical protein
MSLFYIYIFFFLPQGEIFSSFVFKKWGPQILFDMDMTQRLGTQS